MKAIKVLIGVALIASAGLNVFFWRQLQRQRLEMEAVRASAAEAETLRGQMDSAKKDAALPSANSDAESRELARLRNEIGQLRKQGAEAEAQRVQSAREVAQLRSQLAATAQRLEDKNRDMAETLKMTSQQMEEAKQRAQSIQCINNMKQIGLAARIYANDHGNVFPPDFAAMKNELNTPKILFCPAAPGGVQAVDWSQLNPATISYQFLNPNGNESDPQKPLTTCPIHGHMGLSDGSVQMTRK